MELDDFKQAWQALDRRLEQQHQFNVQLFRDTRLDTLRRGLRPLAWGQAMQIALGVLGLLIIAPIWMAHRDNFAVLVAGITLHVYCIGLIAIGAMVCSKIARIDYGASVLSIQRQLIDLRRTYAVYGTLACGLPWWFLTAPLLVVLSRGAIMVAAPSVVWVQLLVGIVGLLATCYFYRWAKRPSRAAFGRRLDDGMSGGSIRRAQRALDEMARFEHEG